MMKNALLWLHVLCVYGVLMLRVTLSVYFEGDVLVSLSK